MKKDILEKAIFFLKKGELVAYPTDTLYGIGADVYNLEAVKKVFLVKKRPMNMPLSVAVSNIEELNDIGFIDKKSRILANRFLPGPLCLVVKKRKIVPDIITSKSKKIAIRIPDNKTALKLVEKFGPITCTSANIHGESTPENIKKIRMKFKDKIALYIDEGELFSEPSTIVDTTFDKIKFIREGSLSKKEIMDAIKNG